MGEGLPEFYRLFAYKFGNPVNKKTKTPASDGFLATAQAELLSQLAVLERRRKELVTGGFDKDLANSAAALGRVLVSLASEMRQQEKHLKQIVERMTDQELDDVLRFHVAGLPKDRQAAFKAFLDELVNSGSVL